MALNPLLSSYNNNINPQDHPISNNIFSLKTDLNNNNNNNNIMSAGEIIPPWLHPSADQDQAQARTVNPNPNLNPSHNPSHGHGGGVSVGVGYGQSNSSVSSPHISATALLQKAAQMGATMSSTTTTSGSIPRPHNLLHVSTGTHFLFFLLFDAPLVIYCGKFNLLFIFLIFFRIIRNSSL